MTERCRAGGEQSRGRRVIAWVLITACLSIFQGRAAVDLVVSSTDSPDPVVTLSNLTYTITLTNAGTTIATNVSITNVLSSLVTFLSVTNTRGSCSNVSGIVHCDWGQVTNGTGGRVTIVARPIAPGVVTNVVSAGALQADANPNDNIATQATTVVNRRRFGSSDFIQIGDVVAGPADPYPSTINVSGLTAAVHKVTVTLTNISQIGPNDTGPDDLDILLVGPTGAYVMLFSDGPTGPSMTDVTVTFDDAAAQFIPDTSAVISGTYKPANYGSLDDVLPSPAPPGPHPQGFTPLSIFNGTDPNGAWRLFVYDDEPEAGGWIDGWGLTLSTMDAMANLGVAMTDSPDPTIPGQTITYISTITNAGPAGATGVRLTNRVAAALEVISYSSTRGTCANAGGTIFCDIGDLAIGGSEQLMVQVRASRGGSYTNQATVSSHQVDPQTSNDIAIQTTTVEPRIDLGVEMSVSRRPALLEQPLIYVLSLTNAGPDTATGVRVVNELPPGVLLVNAAPSQGSCSNQSGVVTCNMGSITNRGRASVLLTCRPSVLGPITNLVAVSGDQVDTDPTNNFKHDENTVDPAAELLLTLSDAPDPVPIGRQITYTIALTNRGPTTASNLVVSDVLPAGLQFVSAQTSHGACTNNGNSISCAVSELPVGERVVITIVATAMSVGTVLNTANVTAQPADPNTLNNTANVNTLVIPTADISVVKTSDSALVWQGDRVSYNVTVSNNGPSTATAVRLQDVLPAGMSFISATSTAGGCTLQSGTVTCTFSDLPASGSLQVSIIASVSLAGSITNTAVGFANEQDLDPANNSAVAVIEVLPKTLSVANTNAVFLPEVGTASEYPLTVNVAGLTSAVQRVRVTLQGLAHSYPDDLDLLLVGPNGQAVVLMSDAGGGTAVTNLDLTIDELALNVLPDSTALSGSHYRPMNYSDETNEFPAPAPSGPYASSFDIFTGTDPNGTWKLYIVDDTVKDGGELRDGWRLDIWARDPMADLGLSVVPPPDLVPAGTNITIAVIVSNHGPANANAVVLTNVYDTKLLFSGVATSQGSCTNEAGVLRCDLGEIAAGSSAFVQISFETVTAGAISNLFSVASLALDFNPANNAQTSSLTVENPPQIIEQPRGQGVPIGGTAMFSVTVEGDPPLAYQWYYNASAILDATNSTLTITNVEAAHFGDYQVEVSNRVGRVFSSVAVLGPPRPPVMEMIPDQLTQEDTLLVVPLIISDPDNPLELFQLSGVCDDTNLIPATNLTFSVSGTNYSLSILSATNLFGTNVITVTATDSAGLSSTRSFVIGVQSVNDYPDFIVPVGDQVVLEDSVTTLWFEIGDVETADTNLIVGGRSYNQSVQPDNWLGFGGTGRLRYIILSPEGNRHGTALMEIRIRDEAGVRSTNLFTLTVLPVEDSPTISFIDDVTISEDTALNVSFLVSDVETSAENLLIRVESSEPALFANDAFTFDGTGASHTLSAMPRANQNGSSRISIFVEDQAGMVASNSFWVTVNPENDPPFVSDIPEIITPMDQTSAEVVFTVGDLESDPTNLTFTAISTNTVLAPLSGIEFGGEGSNRTVRVTPGAGEVGWMVLQVAVEDPDGGVTHREFELVVHPTNGAPLIVRQPEAQALTIGAPLRLRVIAKGPGKLSYQWRRAGVELPNATNAVFDIAAVAGTDRGEYRVRVTNEEGSVLSEAAQVTILETTRILSIRRNEQTVELTFNTISGQRYFVEFQDALDAGWTALPEALGTGDIVTVIDDNATAATRFYRVRVE